MNFEGVEKIAAAILYEGYILYPYRKTAIKNRQRWNFGTLYPRTYAEAQHPQEPFRLVAECLVVADAEATLDVRLSFLQLVRQDASTSPSLSDPSLAWDEAVERSSDHHGLRLSDLITSPLALTGEKDLSSRPERSAVERPAVPTSATALNGSATLPFVIPSAAEGSAVLSKGSLLPAPSDDLSSRPERSVVEGPAVPTSATALNGSATLPIVILSSAEGSAVLSKGTLLPAPSDDLSSRPERSAVEGPAVPPNLQIELTVSAQTFQNGACKIRFEVQNITPLASGAGAKRDEALPLSFVSAHLLLRITGGEFVSLLDPDPAYRETAAACTQTGVFPVLAGEEPDRSLMLCSPIILYDYPKIAPESAGDFFDGTEMDEMLTLRVLTLTDAEKQEMRSGDPRARRILERTEALTSDAMLKAHGVIRGFRDIRGDAP